MQGEDLEVFTSRYALIINSDSLVLVFKLIVNPYEWITALHAFKDQHYLLILIFLHKKRSISIACDTYKADQVIGVLPF